MYIGLASSSRSIYATTPFVAVLLLKFFHRQTGLKLDSVHGHGARSVSTWRTILDFTPASESSN
ncbi:MAG: hypothetical protein VB124_04315 [Burkholderia sp.]